MAPRTLDLRDFHGAKRAEFAQQALEGFATDGFIKLVGHGVSAEEFTQLLAWVSKGDI